MPWRKQLPQFFATSGRLHGCTPQKTQIFSNIYVRTSNVAFCNMLIYYSAVWFAPCPTTKLEDCLFQAVRDWLFSVLASAPRCPEGVFCICKRETRSVVATKDSLSVTVRIILLVLFSHNFISAVNLIFHIIIITTTILIFVSLSSYLLLINIHTSSIYPLSFRYPHGHANHPVLVFLVIFLSFLSSSTLCPTLLHHSTLVIIIISGEGAERRQILLRSGPCWRLNLLTLYFP